MQLILVSEATIDIKGKMTTLEESPVKDLKEVDIFENDIINGNNDNIKCKRNLINISEDLINGDCKNDVELATSLPTESSKLGNTEELKQNGETELEKNQEKEVSEENTYDKKIISIDNSVVNKHIISEENHANCHRNGEKRNTDIIDAKSNSILSLKESEVNARMNEDNVSELMITEREFLKSNNEEIELKEDNQIICQQSLESVTSENEIFKDISKLNDTDINMDVDEDITKIADYIKATNHNSNLTASTFSANNQLLINETNMKTDKTKVNEEYSTLFTNENTLRDIIEDSVDTGDNVSLKTKLCSNVALEETMIVDDKISNGSDCEENVVNENITECDKAGFILEEENIKASEHSTVAENAINVKVNKDKTIMEGKEISNEDDDKTTNRLTNITGTVDILDKKAENFNNTKDIPVIENAKITENVTEIEDIPDVPQAKRTENIAFNVEDTKNTENCIETEAILDIDETKKESENILKEGESNVDECKENENITDTEVILNVRETKDIENVSDIEKNIIEEEVNKSNINEGSVKLPGEVPQSQKKLGEPKKIITKLSNTLDILSDDEELPPDTNPKENTVSSSVKQCINIEDDDDIMLIDEDSSSKDIKQDSVQKLDTLVEKQVEKKEEESKVDSEPKTENRESCSDEGLPEDNASLDTKVESSTSKLEKVVQKEEHEKESIETPLINKPLLPESFLKTHKKNLTDMTRDELEEFCILKIVESIVDRSNLSEIKSKLKSMAQNIDEYKKKAMMLTKQNRDLQVVLKSVQEEQKKKSDSAIMPLKITRSVGMQVIMQDKIIRKKLTTNNTNNATANKNIRASNQSPRQQKQTTAANQQIPVPRLVPAHGMAAKPIAAPQPAAANQNKTPSPVPNGVRPSAQKTAEKRPHTRLQSVTVDLTDDEPPAKLPSKISPAPPVRLVSPQSLLAPQRQPFGQTMSSPRKVYIPISSPQNQNIRPGQTIMLKTLPAPRQRCPTQQLSRMPQNTVRMTRVQNRHPAALPDAMKQYQPPNWKALPPAPDLKLSKVENGIVISWKIEGYQEDSYEEIASYQLYAYQETASPPSTTLWKKIGDVKALPLPMACTLTQFMAGFKYYFAVRAVDVRSRVGPFSLPGSILLLSKM